VLARGLSHLPLDPRQRERALALARDALPPVKRRRGAPAALSFASPTAGTRAANRRANRTEAGAEHRAESRVDDAKTRAPGPEDVAGLAAAVAYAIVYIDHVPLSQAEVAAPFRVGVAHLRGRFAELRAKLDIIRGDARYATTRR
jgi:hypothetical protein